MVLVVAFCSQLCTRARSWREFAKSRFTHFPSILSVHVDSYVTIFNIYVTNWEVCAQERLLWRSMIHIGARTAETHRIAEAQKKRAARKAILYSTTSASAGPTYPCPECGRVLQASIGPISYLRTHMVNQT